MGVKERRAREKEQLQQQILVAARELFVNEGYENVSMRKIADKIEYSPTTIYLYFKDKADLLDSVCQETLLSLLNTLDELKKDKSDPVETLRKSGRVYVAFGLKYPQDYKLTFVIRPQFQKGLGLQEGSIGEKVFKIICVKWWLNAFNSKYSGRWISKPPVRSCGQPFTVLHCS